MSIAEKLEMLVTLDPSSAVAGFKEISENADKMGGKVESSFSKVAGAATKIGVAGLGVGAVLTDLGSKEQAASQQLEASISAAGQSFDDYKGRIDSTISKMEGFDHGAVDTQDALSKLTAAYGDTGKALDQMQLVADLAAAKHESLADAATQVAKAHGGAARIFKEFGIQVGTNAQGTKDYDGALTQLSQKLSGQASAASDSFVGHFKAIGITIEDNVAKFGEKWGPTILAASGLLTGFGTVSSGVTGILGKLTKAREADAAATEAEKAAQLGFGSSLMSAGAFALPLVAVLPLMKISLDGAAASAKETASEMQNFSNAVNDTNGKLDDNINKAILLNITNSHVYDTVKNAGLSIAEMGGEIRQASPDLVALQKSMKDAGDNTSAFADAIRNARGASDPFVQSLIAAHDAGKITDTQFRDMVGNTVALGTELGKAKTQANNMKGAEEALGTPTAEQTQKLKDQAAAYDKIRKSADDAEAAILRMAPADIRAQQGSLNIQEAQNRLADAQQKLNDAQASGDPKAIASATRELQSAQLSLEQSTLDEAQALADLAEIQDKVNGHLDTSKEKTDNYLGALSFLNDGLTGPTHDALNQYIWDAARASIATEDLKNSLLGIDTSQPFLDPRIPGFKAAGGPVSANTPYIVGEKGPELFTPSTSGTITPNDDLAVAGGTFQFYISANEPVAAAYEIAQHIRAQQFLMR